MKYLLVFLLSSSAFASSHLKCEVQVSDKESSVFTKTLTLHPKRMKLKVLTGFLPGYNVEVLMSTILSEEKAEFKVLKEGVEVAEEVRVTASRPAIIWFDKYKMTATCNS